MPEEFFLGSFDSMDEALLAAEMTDALLGGRAPIRWQGHATSYAEAPDGLTYRIGPYKDDPVWYAQLTEVDEDDGWPVGKAVWQQDFDTEEAAKAGAEADWAERFPSAPQE